MKLCIPTDNGQGLDAKLAEHFGSAPFFTFVDTDTGKLQVHANASGGAHPGGCHHVEMLSQHGVDAVACVGIGRNAFAKMQQSGIQVFVPTGGVVKDVVDAARLGALAPMAAAATCGGHGSAPHGGAGHGCSHHGEPAPHHHD